MKFCNFVKDECSITKNLESCLNEKELKEELKVLNNGKASRSEEVFIELLEEVFVDILNLSD